MTHRLTVIEWLAVAVIVGSVGYLLFGPQRSPSGAADVPALSSLLRVEEGPNGRPLARIDDTAMRAACVTAGLPDPPLLDGGDPVPIRKLLGEIERWAHDGNLEALGRIGQIYQATESHQAALTCFVALAELDPGNPAWDYAAGAEAQALGLQDLAIAALERAREADPEYPTTYARLGLLYLERGDLDLAEQRYRRCVELLPGQSLGYVGLGRVALARGDHAAAVRHLERAVTVTTNDFMAYRFLGRALAGAGRSEDAMVASARAEALPHYGGWLVFDARLAQSHAIANSQRYLENQMREARGRGDIVAFIERGKELVRRRPDDHNSIGLLATAYAQLARWDEAKDAAARVLALQPGNPPMHCLLANIALLEKDHASAERLLDAAIASDRTFAPAWDLRGRLFFAQGRHDEAVAAMQEAIRLAPGSPNASLALADMLTQMQRYDDAVEVLRTLLARSPGHAGALQRLQAIEARRRMPG